MERVHTPAGDYTLYRGAEAPRLRDEHEPDKWYFEPEDYVGLTRFSDGYLTLEDARGAALECGEREERLRNEIGGGG